MVCMRKGTFVIGLVFLITLAVAFAHAVSAELVSVDPCQGNIFISHRDGFFNFYSKCFTVSIAEDYSSAVFHDEYSRVPFELFISSYHDVNADNPSEFKEFLMVDLGMKGEFNKESNGVTFISGDGSVRVNYFIENNKFEVTYEQDNWVSGYMNGMFVVNTVATKDTKAVASLVSMPAMVDSIKQSLVVSKEKVATKDVIRQVAFVGSGFDSLVLDPLYQVDYSPIPAEHLINGTVESYSDSQFGQLLNITSGVSDSNDSTQYLVFNSTYSAGSGAVNINFFIDSGSNRTDEILTIDSSVATSNIDFLNGKHATINTTGSGRLYTGSIIRFYVLSPDTTSQGKTVYISDPVNTSLYYGSFVNPAGTGYYEWHNVTLSGVPSGGLSSVWLHDDGQTGSVKMRADYIHVENGSSPGGQAITGRWNQTYDASYQWFLRVKKTTSGTTTGRVYAYYNNNSINITRYVMDSLAGAGWFNINVSSLIQYETQVAGLNYTQLRFYTYDSSNFSEMYLRKEANDTQSPQFSSCQVNDSSLVNNEVARFQCNVTDNLDVGYVNGTVEGVTYNFTKNGDVYYYDWSCMSQNLFVDWTFIQAVDILGNYNSTNPGITISCNYDTTPPTVTIMSPQNISYNSSSVAMSVSANEAVNTWRYSLDSAPNVTFTPNTTLSGLSGGSHTVVVYANDTYGNLGSNQVSFTVDISAPGIIVYSPVNVTYYASTSVPLQVSANETISAWWYFKDGSSTPTYFTPNTTLSGLSQGLHNISVYANDTAGNIVTSGLRYFTVDTIVPTVVMTIPQNQTYVMNSVALNVSVDELISLWVYSLDSGVNISFSPNITLDFLSDSLHHVVVYATDFANHTGSDSVWFTVDANAPVITVYSPVNGTYYVNTSVPLQVSVNELFSACWYFMDGNVTPTYFTPNITLSGLSQGFHNITVICNDTSGNGGTSGVIYFNVDTVAPIVQIVSPLNASYNVSVVWLEVVADELISSWVYSLDSGSNTSFSPNITLNALSYGSHHVEVYGTDFVNNSGYDSVWFTTTSNVTYNFTGNLTLSIYYPPMSTISQGTLIQAIVQEGGVNYPFGDIDISIEGGSNVSMVYNATTGAYFYDWVPSSAGTYDFIVYASNGNETLSRNGSIIVTAVTYDVCIRLWTNVNMTAGSQYKNEFSWVFAEYTPFDETLHTIFEAGEKYHCPPQSTSPQACMWHDKYQNGSACVTLYMPGNYTFWIVGENVNWKQDIGNGYVQDCEFCNFNVVRKQFLQNMGEYYFNGAENENLDLYFNPAELYVGGAFFGFLSSWFFIIIYAVIGFVAFIFTLYATGSVKSALAIMVLLPAIINLVVAYSGILP